MQQLILKYILILIAVFLIYQIFRYIKNKIIDIIESNYRSKIKYSTLEILIPTEIERTPLSMENVFSMIHGALIEPGFFDYFFKGIREYTFSFEIIGRDGLVHYYLKVPEEYKELVKNALYSNFPTVEIEDAKDWAEDLPEFNEKAELEKNKKIYNLKIGELNLSKEDAYPIKTYLDFGFKEKLADKEEEERISDPLSGVLEALGTAEKDEFLIYQIASNPEPDKWKEDGEKLINKILGREGTNIFPEEKKPKGIKKAGGAIVKESKNIINELIDRILHLITGATPATGTSEKKSKEEIFPKAMALSKREQELVEKIQKNISKFGFKVQIRLAYIAPKEKFNKIKYENLVSAFKQFNSLELNGFEINGNFSEDISIFDFLKIKTLYYLWWKHKKFFPINKKNLRNLRKFEVFSEIKKRGTGGKNRGHKSFVLNTEELATIYHLPGKGIIAPYVKRIEAKRKRPPIHLPRE